MFYYKQSVGMFMSSMTDLFIHSCLYLSGDKIGCVLLLSSGTWYMHRSLGAEG